MGLEVMAGAARSCLSRLARQNELEKEEGNVGNVFTKSQVLGFFMTQRVQPAHDRFCHAVGLLPLHMRCLICSVVKIVTLMDTLYLLVAGNERP